MKSSSSAQSLPGCAASLANAGSEPSAAWSAIDGELPGRTCDIVTHTPDGRVDQYIACHVIADHASLLAAAPELLEALRPLADCEIVECDTPLLDSDSARYFISMGEIRAARAALAKAETRS